MSIRILDLHIFINIWKSGEENFLMPDFMGHCQYVSLIILL